MCSFSTTRMSAYNIGRFRGSEEIYLPKPTFATSRDAHKTAHSCSTITNLIGSTNIGSYSYFMSPTNTSYIRTENTPP